MRDRVQSEEVRRKTRVVVAIVKITILKWNWVGHLVRPNDNKWTKGILRRRLRNNPIRNRESPATPSSVDLKAHPWKLDNCGTEQRKLEYRMGVLYLAVDNDIAVK